MPKLPGSSSGNLGLGATQIRGAGLSATPVDALSGGMPNANGKAGSGFGGMADMLQVFDNARRENEFQKGKVEIFSAMRDLRTQIEQDADTDPASILTKHDDGIKALRTGLTERYKNDEAVLNKLLPQVDNFANEQTQQVRSLSFKRTVDQGRADGMVNDDILLSTLSKASGPKDFDWALQLHADDVDSKRATGVYSAVEAEHRKLNFAKAVEHQRQVFGEEQRLNNVHAALFKNFGKNPNGAVAYLENPQNWEALGIGHKDALHFISVFDSQAARDKRRSDEARAAGERSELNAYWKAVDGGDFEKAQTVLSRARNISGERLVHMKQALKKDQWDDDPKVVADVQRRIWSGELTNDGDIAPLMGNGISPKTAKTLRDDMEKIGKEAPEYPGAMNFYSNALGRYKATFKDTPMAEHEGKFAATLSYQAKQKKIGPFDPRMDALADEILAVVDKPWFGKDKTKFEKQFEGKTLPGVPSDSGAAAAMPAPRPVPAPVSKASSIQQIPPAQYSAVKQALAQAGRDTSDETVLSVWMANRDKLKAGK